MWARRDSRHLSRLWLPSLEGLALHQHPDRSHTPGTREKTTRNSYGAKTRTRVARGCASGRVSISALRRVRWIARSYPGPSAEALGANPDG
jgi:hypothetical protein